MFALLTIMQTADVACGGNVHLVQTEEMSNSKNRAHKYSTVQGIYEVERHGTRGDGDLSL
jgi:hypothetical protein